jgi:hypothetical protein
MHALCICTRVCLRDQNKVGPQEYMVKIIKFFKIVSLYRHFYDSHTTRKPIKARRQTDDLIFVKLYALIHFSC